MDDLDLDLDLVCVSYLADTTVLKVETYPGANSGAAVRDVETSIAADGPIVALAAARLGLRTGLIANHVGRDAPGGRLVARLNDHGVQHTISLVSGTRTPHLTVVADQAGTRTWFADLAAALNTLATADVSALARARLAYIDCYHAISGPAVLAIKAALDTPLFLNLGGDALTDTITTAAARCRVAAVQTNLDEARAPEAEHLAKNLIADLRADAAIVTLGSLGALVLTRHDLRHVPATALPPVQLAHTHGAGAAFSAGYAHALLGGADPLTATRAGCDVGTAHCLTAAIREGSRS